VLPGGVMVTRLVLAQVFRVRVLARQPKHALDSPLDPGAIV
jgi:hypothetical protein